MATTLEQLHTAAEWLLAGPQHAASGTIRLRVTDQGIATVADPDLELTVDGLRHDDWDAPYGGRVEALAAAVGIVCRRPEVTYHDPVPGGPETLLDPDPQELAAIFSVYRIGQEALTAFAPQERITLWPEHFDLAIRGGSVNYGVSPGDRYCAAPYAYVGPDEHGDDPFWNAPFGASWIIAPDTDAAAVVAFFARGRELAR
jgi:hypothetical protein